MAFAKGNDSVTVNGGEGGKVKLYTGIAPVTVLAVNPTASELSKIYGRTVEKVADYTGKDKNGLDYARVDIIVQVSKEFNNDAPISKLSFFMRPTPQKNAAGTKVKVINDYGQTSWVTKEILEEKGVPQANDGTELTGFLMPYRPSMVGEEELVKFVIAYLSINNMRKMQDNVMVNKTGDELKECLAGFSADEIKKITKGNVAPLKDILGLRPGNFVKVMFTVTTNNDNKKYQNILNSFFAKGKDFGCQSRFETHMNGQKDRLSNVEYSIDFKEFVETPTVSFNQGGSEDELPWG